MSLICEIARGIRRLSVLGMIGKGRSIGLNHAAASQDLFVRLRLPRT